MILYLMTHNKTGLKYLGKTTQSLSKYNGSGIRWKRHLKVYGLDITKEVLAECSSKEELQRLGKHYSDLWDVVNDPSFANMRDETGDGGDTSSTPAYQQSLKRGRFWSAESRQSVSDYRKANPRTSSSIQKQRETITGSLCWNNGQTVVRSPVCPGEGWVRGRLDHSTAVPISYEGNLYPSISACAKQLGISPRRVRKYAVKQSITRPLMLSITP